MRWSVHTLLLTSFAFAMTGSARAQFTAIYSFGAAITDVPSVANVTFNSLTSTNVSSTYSAGNTNVTVNNWVTGGGSADTTEFLSVSLNANTGFTLSLTSFSFKTSRSSTGPASVSVELFVGGVSQGVSSTFSPTNTTTTTTAAMNSNTFDFADLTSIAATSTVTFRVYGWGGTGSSGNLRVDDLTINGTVSAIPEPSTYSAIFGAAVLGCAVWRRKQQKKNSVTATPA